ncbi:MAG: ROK family protein [Firmicutes bacterium]|nr:ROK family protein [Bacillota bacterium]
MKSSNIQIKPKMIPILDKDFRPASLENRAFLKAVEESGEGVPLAIALERGDGLISTYRTKVFSEDSAYAGLNMFYVERLVKTLLWIRGGWKIIIGGPGSVGDYIRKAYSAGGIREFDSRFMSRVYEKPFTVEVTEYDRVPESKEDAKPVGRHLKGCRIGFDAGGSDRKVSAVIDGEAVFSEEVIWHPKLHSDPDYHYNEILAAMKSAAAHMPRVDAIGVSSAGIYINNRVMVASLFIKVPEDLFEKKVKDIYINISKEMGGVPIEVANDGDVTALAGAMELNDTNVLGIAMGTSEAGGYVDSNGNITGWLNELAFVPVDYNPGSMVDEWSGDYGCGVKYFSQDAVIKLAPAAGILLDSKLSPAEKLKSVQELLAKGDNRAVKIFETIGCYLGYAIAHYADFYDLKHLLILGRVTSGEGGNIILRVAREVLKEEFPELEEKIKIHLPDESSRRVGQSIAAASLPEII